MFDLTPSEAISFYIIYILPFLAFWILTGILMFRLFHKLHKSYILKNPAKNIPKTKMTILIFVLAILIIILLMLLFPSVGDFFDKYIFRYFESGVLIPFITAFLIITIIWLIISKKIRH